MEMQVRVEMLSTYILLMLGQIVLFPQKYWKFNRNLKVQAWLGKRRI